MRRQLNAPTCGSASWSDTRPQTETETPNASLANELRMSANCRPDISHRAAITPHDGIRITAAHNAFPATFTDPENNGYLASILMANSPDALRTLCEQRSMEENKRWRNWWNLHPGLRKWRYTIQPQNTSTGLRMHEDEIDVAAYNIAKSIKRRGIKGRPFLNPMLSDAKMDTIIELGGMDLLDTGQLTACCFLLKKNDKTKKIINDASSCDSVTGSFSSI